MTLAAPQNRVPPRNLNHPRKGAAIKVEPIRDLEAIKDIKRLLADRPRDLCLFTFGINTAYRAGELLSLHVGQVAHLSAGDRLDIKQSKTRRYRAATLNGTVISALALWLSAHPDPRDKAPLFISKRTGQALTVSAAHTLIKGWCREIGLPGNYGTHTMRKTWGYQQRVRMNRPLPLLMAAFGHTSQAQTFDYLCIQDDEIRDLYGMEL